MTSPEVHLAEMRAWLSECDWQDVDAEDIAELPDETIRRAVDKHYCGGVRQFVRDGAR